MRSITYSNQSIWKALSTRTEAFEKAKKPLFVTSKIIVHLVCKMNWVTENKSSTYYDINYWASFCTNGVSEICKTLQASEFWMQYKQPILSLFGSGCGFQEMVTSSIILKIYIDPWPRAPYSKITLRNSWLCQLFINQ